MDKTVEDNVLDEDNINLYQFFKICNEFCGNYLTDKDIKNIYAYIDNKKKNSL